MQNEYNMCMTILLLIVGFVRAEHLLFSDCGIRTSRRQPRSSSSANNANSNEDSWSGFYNTNHHHSGSTTSTESDGPAAMADTDPDGPNRNPKIMHGVPTLEGQYPWQVSLELMHPSYGFIGHWCGGVLIDRNWVLSAAHCVHNELFNLPLPALWTVVLGEYDRGRESGYEQRIPVDKIILHEKYHNFKHDLVLLKLNRPANIAPNSRVKKICLPFADIKVNSVPFDPRPELDRLHQQTKTSQLFYFDYLGRPPDKGGGRPVEEDGPTKEDVVDEESELNAEDASTDFPDALPDREDNYLRRLRLLGESGAPEYRRPRTARVVVNQLVRKRLQQSPSSELVGNATRARSESASRRSFRRGRRLYQTADFDDDDDDDDEDNGWGTRHGGKRRRNDKFAHGGFYRNEHYRNEFGEDVGGGASDAEPISAIPDTSQYVDCLATGWGKSTIDDELTDILLQTKAPIQNSKKCEEAYGDFIKLHRGHLCAGNLDGTGGTCVGDSGGPLQCRITKHGPWILVGITSFGSGCAFKNYPDVYTKISFYRQWIVDTIQGN
ncbi:uncharacterized protein LOC6051539 isoform X2 [Culex quinquefasciatus]|uniref:uncharacterized protein LOC6051539 isoform X2 n=1 Tax=Culex quinquefasciatus TaxID=7176 RepID=UPI0018E325C0|nr:uncharacterized protein LOC6051539 isoform X2 [Culex quinquefasciatus]